MNEQNAQKCPHCDKAPPQSFQDWDTCDGAYDSGPTEYGVCPVSADQEGPEVTGFRCLGEARDYAETLDTDWKIGRR